MGNSLKWLLVVLAVIVVSVGKQQFVHAEEKLCDGKDDDEDGTADEDWDVGKPCWDGLGPCRELGVWQCNGGKIALCKVTNRVVFQKPEECNGLDDDCDGVVDNLIYAASCFVKSEGNLCNQGRLVCALNGTPNCVPHPPQPEICGNDLDEDCDGLTPLCIPDGGVGEGGGGGQGGQDGGLGVPCRQIIYKDAECSLSPSSPSPLLPLSAIAVVGAMISFVVRRRHHKL